jgi:ABC-2 type transport system permease protein
MNLEHLKTFIWLRYRLRRNQFRRAGTLNAVLQIILSVMGIVGGIGLFGVFFLVALFAFPKAELKYLMYTWDGLIVAFLFSWMVGLLAELQRSEVLSLGKFLHLPVSLGGAFLINYLSTFASLTLIIFLPAMAGFALGLIFARGPYMLLLVPLLAALLFMVTALTYQLQGWLAALMTNPRRRRTVIVIATMIFVVIAQAPQLIHLVPGIHKNPDEPMVKQLEAYTRLDEDFAAGLISEAQRATRRSQIDADLAASLKASNQQTKKEIDAVARSVNLIPFLWPALGAMQLAEGQAAVPLLFVVGLTLIGGGSLWRSYRTTLRLYTGDFGSKQAPAPTATPAPLLGKVRTSKPSTGFLERQLPWISEHASAITLTSLRSLIRAPEAKMMLLAPIILVVVFGGIFMQKSASRVPELARPLIALGMMAAILLSMVQIVGNQFGFDRSGFRVFVLCPAKRRDILLGKNLAMLPVSLSLGLMVVLAVQFVLPMRWDYFLAALPEALSMYLLFCMMANCLSILAPMYIAPGAMRPSNVKVIPVLLQLAAMLLQPLIMALCLLPLGAQIVLEEFGMAPGVPIGLALAVLVCAAIIYVYYLTVGLQGRWLQSRELRILEIVTAKQE